MLSCSHLCFLHSCRLPYVPVADSIYNMVLLEESLLREKKSLCGNEIWVIIRIAEATGGERPSAMGQVLFLV